MVRNGTFCASELMSDADVTINVTLVMDWRFRLGLWLMRLGARIMGARNVCVVELEHDQAGSPTQYRPGRVDAS